MPGACLSPSETEGISGSWKPDSRARSQVPPSQALGKGLGSPVGEQHAGFGSSQQITLNPAPLALRV